MKRTKAIGMVILMLLGVLGSGVAYARGPNVHFGVAIGGPAYWPGYYYGAHDYYLVPPFYVAPAMPTPAPVYMERELAADTAVSWWHYCAESKAYYPYVKVCPGPWQRVAPQPPG